MKLKPNFKKLLMALAPLGACSCVSENFAKLFEEEPVHPTTALNQGSAVSSEAAKTDGDQPSAENEELFLIRRTQGSSFEVSASSQKVWKALITVLSKDYHLLAVDRPSGVLTTDWDSYYKDQEVYRDRVSLRLDEASAKAVGIIIKIERQILDRNIAGPALWLPITDSDAEINRIVNNLAALLKISKTRIDPALVAN